MTNSTSPERLPKDIRQHHEHDHQRNAEAGEKSLGLGVVVFPVPALAAVETVTTGAASETLSFTALAEWALHFRKSPFTTYR